VPEVTEALACGVPVVATGWGCAGEAVDGKAVLGVESVQAPSPEPGFAWADPYYGMLRSAMREAFENAPDARKAALAASETIRRELSWDRIAAGMVERLS
jgi:glycosyltransferase involved in cell wall biosynthesis